MDLARIEEHGETAPQQTKPEQTETQIPGGAPRPPLPGAHKRGGDGGGGGRIVVNAERERAAGGSRNELARHQPAPWPLVYRERALLARPLYS